MRCAKCKHSWFQASPALDRPPAPMLAPEPQPAPMAPEAPIAPPPPAVSPAVAADPGTERDYDAFAHEPPFRPRRNPARTWTIAAVSAGAVMLIAAAALLFGNLPSFAAMLGLPLGGGETPLKFVNLKKPERRDLVAILNALPKHIGYIIIEHDLDVALRVSEYVSMMHNGRLFKEGTPQEIEADPEVQEIYLGGKHG